MAKKKKTKAVQQLFSETKYIKERLRQLPIVKCFMSTGWEISGIVNVYVVREHKQGTFTLGAFHVDTFCLGVKKTFYSFNMCAMEYDKFLDWLKHREYEVKEVSYEEAHNMIWGAVAFAEDGGISPDKSFDLTQYVLEEDSEDIPLIEYEYGKNGQHFLVVNDKQELSKYYPKLCKALGEDVKYMVNVSDDAFGLNNARRSSKWNKNLVIEKYHYDAPKYPKRQPLHYQQLPDLLGKTDYSLDLPNAVLDGEILSLDHELLKEDLEHIILSTIGNGNKNKASDWNALYHSVFLLAEVGDDYSLDVVLECLRQDSDFVKYCFGDIGDKAFVPTIAKLGKNRLDLLSAFLHTPGLVPINRHYVMNAVSVILIDAKERRAEIIEWWRSILNFYRVALPECNGCDSPTAAFAMCFMMRIGASELCDEVKAIFATGLVEDEICGLEDEVLDRIVNSEPHYEIYSLEIHERYEGMRNLRNSPLYEITS